MKIGIIGPESSGGRYMERMLNSSPDKPEVHHWSVPYGPSRGERWWPPLRCPDLILSMDKIIVTIRDWHSMVLSATKEHTNNQLVAELNARQALCDIFALIEDHPSWRVVVYESLESDQSVLRLFEWLEIARPAELEQFTNGNEKWNVRSWWERD